MIVPEDLIRILHTSAESIIASVDSSLIVADAYELVSGRLIPYQSQGESPIRSRKYNVLMAETKQILMKSKTAMMGIPSWSWHEKSQ